jgi:hypothetical protein
VDAKSEFTVTVQKSARGNKLTMASTAFTSESLDFDWSFDVESILGYAGSKTRKDGTLAAPGDDFDGIDSSVDDGDVSDGDAGSSSSSTDEIRQSAEAEATSEGDGGDSAETEDVPVPEEFLCPLTLNLMRDPVVSKWGHR